MQRHISKSRLVWQDRPHVCGVRKEGSSSSRASRDKTIVVMDGRTDSRRKHGSHGFVLGRCGTASGHRHWLSARYADLKTPLAVFLSRLWSSMWLCVFVSVGTATSLVVLMRFAVAIP